ncbi:MAG: transketolase [delta proteobacterium ML8_F1]|nr:MAG: transketolase [delta proteobacterium ML8_F1]
MNAMDKKVIETIRFLSIDAINAANSGHPGLPMGSATMAFALWKEFLKTSKEDPKWIDRDRFVLSAGHGSMLLYALLHLFGYSLTLEDLKDFRQLGSVTPGHPEYGLTPGVETTTGPLGQGFANAVGMAIAESRLRSQFKEDLVDHYTYVIAGDGDLMEGITSEASSLAGHLGLGRLIVLYDDNRITIDGETSITFTEDVSLRYEAYGWQVIEVADGEDYEAVVKALKAARAEAKKPTLIRVKTVIGYGSPRNAGKSSAHGSPLGEDEARIVKEAFGWDPDRKFHVPGDVTAYMAEIIAQKSTVHEEWFRHYEEVAQSDPDRISMLESFYHSEISEKLLEDEILWSELSRKDATRNTGGKMLNALSLELPNLMGGSADLNGSTKTYLKNRGDFTAADASGNNLFFGVREHAMAGILNGIALHGGFRAYGATFLSFADYMKPSIRLAALMKLPVVFVFTHDSIGVGEDGPTHQPIEQVAMLRSIPGLKVFRPADGKETGISWVEALKYQGPSALVLTRQNVPCLEGVNKTAHYGAYILKREKGPSPDLILMATGSEVPLALDVAKALEGFKVDARVVSMPSWEHFLSQPRAYQEEVLPREIVKRVSIEALSTFGWHQFLGGEGLPVGIDTFGESGPAPSLFDHFGFTTEKILTRILEYLNQ